VILVNGIRALPPVRLARPKAPVALVAHDVVSGRDFARLAKWGLGGVDQVVAVSQVTAAPLERYGVPIKVVFNGTPWPVEPAPSQPPEPLTVGIAAALTPWKGQGVLLDAMARIDRRDVHLELMGRPYAKDVGYAEMLHRQVESLGLAERVHFLGQVAKPLERVRRWAISVVASTDPEPGPLTMIEAMSVGVPVVATAHGGPTELLGEAGLLVPPGDPAAMARALGQVLDDPELRRRCREAGRSKVQHDLVLADRTAELLRVLEDLAQSGPSRSRWRGRDGSRGRR
jgi:glycosyltransferase involved in cell wall biosynthesis